nr:thiamine pyrophosphate-dependent enzyme [Dyella humicola]
MSNPYLASMARSMDIRGIRLERPEEIEERLAEALSHDGSVLVDPLVSRTELAMSPSITRPMAKGFSL